MRIPKTLLDQWIDKLRDEKLRFRESWRITDYHRLRCRNPLTDQFHYLPLGLLLRTDVGKTKGKFHEVEFPEVESYFIMPGVMYTPYDGYEPQPRKPLPLIGDIGPRILVKKFQFDFMSAKESCDFSMRMQQRKTFEEVAEFLEITYGGKKKPVITHSNPLLQF